MPSERELFVTAYHEAGHGGAIERLKRIARIALEDNGKWNPITVADPPLPNKGDDSAEVGIAGPIAEALIECNSDEPDRITLPIWLDSPENILSFVQFGEAVVANRLHRTRLPVQLRLHMQDKTWQRVWVSAEDYDHFPDECDEYSIAALVKRVAADVQSDWGNVHRIATALENRKKYDTDGFATFVG